MRELQLRFIGNQSVMRWFRLLNTIERERTFTVNSLTSISEVTQRTIIKDLKYFKEYFSTSATFTKSARGYFFNEIDPDLYKEQKRHLLDNEVLFEIVGQIFYGELETIDELAFLYNYSESTFRRLLLQIEPVLAEYDLRLTMNPVNFVGDEGSLRKFFKDFFYEGEQTVHTLMPPQALQDLLLATLSEKLGKYELGTGTTPAAFYYTLYVAVERYRKGNKISLPKEVRDFIYQEKDYQLLTYLTDEIEKTFGVRMAEEEFAWVYLVTVCKRPISHINDELLFFERFNLWPEISLLTEAYQQKNRQDRIEPAAIKAFLNSFFLSRKINDVVSPALNKVMAEINTYIAETRPDSYEENQHFLIENQAILSFSQTYIKDIAASLTIFYDSLSTYYRRSKKIVFLLEGDHFICQNIRFHAEYLLGGKHELIFMPLQYLTEDKLNESQVDLIVTNYPPYVMDYILSTDYLLISSVPDKADWQRMMDKVH